MGLVPLVWGASLGAREGHEGFLAYAKANPGKLTYASSGAGAPQRMCAELFRGMTGADMIHVPYRAAARP